MSQTIRCACGTSLLIQDGSARQAQCPICHKVVSLGRDSTAARRRFRRASYPVGAGVAPPPADHERLPSPWLSAVGGLLLVLAVVAFAYFLLAGGDDPQAQKETTELQPVAVADAQPQPPASRTEPKPVTKPAVPKPTPAVKPEPKVVTRPPAEVKPEPKVEVKPKPKVEAKPPPSGPKLEVKTAPRKPLPPLVLLTPPPHLWRGHKVTVCCVAFSGDGRRALSSSSDVSGAWAQKKREDNSVRLWDVRSGKELKRLSGFRDGIQAVTFSPDGRFALLASSGKWKNGVYIPAPDHHVRLWNVETDEEIVLHMAIPKAGGDQPAPKEAKPAVTPSGKGPPKKPEPARSEARFQGHTDEVWCVAFARDGRRALSGGRDGTARVWDMETGKALQTLKHDTGVRSAVFTPDGKLVLTSDGRTIHVWDAETGAAVRKLEGHKDIVWCVAVSPDGKFALSGSGLQEDPKGTGFTWGAKDFTVRLWDLAAGSEVRRFVGHTQQVSCVTFAPDGKAALSCSYDKTVRLWDVETGRELRNLKGHTDGVRSVAFSHCGRFALSGGSDTVLRCWELFPTPASLLKALETRDVPALTKAVEGLAAMGKAAQATRPALLAALTGSNEEVQRLALAGLRQLGPPERDQLPKLIGLLKDPRSVVRLYAIESLNPFGPEARGAVPDLKKLLTATNRSVRAQAALALAKIDVTAAPEAAPLLVQLLKPATAAELKDAAATAARKEARKGLVAIGEPSVKELMKAYPRFQGGDKGSAEASLNAEGRREVLEILGELGKKAAAARMLLENAIRSDPDPLLRVTARSALRNVAGS